MLQLAGRRSRKSGGRKRPQERGCGYRRSSVALAHFGRRFHGSSIVIDRAAGRNDQAVEVLGKRSLVDGRSASGLASSAEKHAEDALAVLHIKECEIGKFRSSDHLAYELVSRAGKRFTRTWSSRFGNLVVLDGGTEHRGGVGPDPKDEGESMRGLIPTDCWCGSVLAVWRDGSKKYS